MLPATPFCADPCPPAPPAPTTTGYDVGPAVAVIDVGVLNGDGTPGKLDLNPPAPPPPPCCDPPPPPPATTRYSNAAGSFPKAVTVKVPDDVKICALKTSEPDV